MANQCNYDEDAYLRHAADLMGVSVENVRKATKVLETGIPELVAVLDNGTLDDLDVAVKIAGLPWEDQKHALTVALRQSSC